MLASEIFAKDAKYLIAAGSGNRTSRTSKEKCSAVGRESMTHAWTHRLNVDSITIYVVSIYKERQQA